MRVIKNKKIEDVNKSVQGTCRMGGASLTSYIHLFYLHDCTFSIRFQYCTMYYKKTYVKNVNRVS